MRHFFVQNVLIIRKLFSFVLSFVFKIKYPFCTSAFLIGPAAGKRDATHRPGNGIIGIQSCVVYSAWCVVDGECLNYTLSGEFSPVHHFFRSRNSPIPETFTSGGEYGMATPAVFHEGIVRMKFSSVTMVTFSSSALSTVRLVRHPRRALHRFGIHYRVFVFQWKFYIMGIESYWPERI